MEKKELYNQIMKSVSKEIKKALNENANENIDMLDYRVWKSENGPFLEKFIKDYLKEYLSFSINVACGEIEAKLYIDGEYIDGCSGIELNPYRGYEE